MYCLMSFDKCLPLCHPHPNRTLKSPQKILFCPFAVNPNPLLLHHRSNVKAKRVIKLTE